MAFWSLLREQLCDYLPRPFALTDPSAETRDRLRHLIPILMQLGNKTMVGSMFRDVSAFAAVYGGSTLKVNVVRDRDLAVRWWSCEATVSFVHGVADENLLRKECKGEGQAEAMKACSKVSLIFVLLDFSM